MPQLTQTDIGELSTILGSGDRGRFYYETAHRLRDVITPELR